MHVFDPLVGVVVALCGLVIGVLSGMFGIGGGTMIVPLFNLVFGMPMISATSTSLFTIVPTALSGAYKHIRQKTAAIRIGVIFGISGAIVSTFGALLAGQLPELVLVLLAAAVIIYSSVTMILQARKVPARHRSASNKAVTKAKGAGDKEVTASGADKDNGLQPHTSARLKGIRGGLPLVLATGIIAGLMAGLIGIGGGFIIIPFSVAYLGFSMKEAAGTSLVAICIIAIPGIITHALLGQVEWLYGLALVVGTIPGAQVGAWLVTKLPERLTRFAFGILLLIAGGLLLISNSGV